MVFQQEFYENFIYSSPKPWFHAFECDELVAGLSFADESESVAFFRAVASCRKATSFASIPSRQQMVPAPTPAAAAAPMMAPRQPQPAPSMAPMSLNMG
jgi:hypothetical protein